jgi:muramoyltetrapeptide carboxypeptidase
MKLDLFSPSGVVADAAALRRAKARLKAMGFAVTVDSSATARHQRFAGTDEARLAAFARVAASDAPVALATRGGYGLTRLLDALPFRQLAKASQKSNKQWVGHSDFTAFQLALLTHVGVPGAGIQGFDLWAGPMACYDFGRPEPASVLTAAGEEHGQDEAVDEITAEVFAEAMRGELEALAFNGGADTKAYDGLSAKGLLWGGNLAMVCSLLGTRHMPAPAQVKGGVLFLEDVAEPPYRVERMLLQLAQAGVLGSQRAVLLGAFTDFKASPLDRGFSLKAVVAHLRSLVKAPILQGLPFGHVPTKLCLPVGREVRLAVDRRQVWLGWGH